MDFEKMTLGELLALDVSEFTPAQEGAWAMAVRSKRGDTKAAPSIQIPAMTGDPLQDAINLQWALQNALNSGTLPANQQNQAWSAYTAASDDVARLMKERETWNAQQAQLQTKYNAEAVKGADAPPVSSGYQWNPETRRYDIPVKETPYEPTISTTARQIWGKLPDGTMGWIDNPNYRPGGTGQARETAEEVYAKDRAKWRAEIEAMIEKKQWEYDHGYVQKPAELQAIKDTAERAIKELDYNYSVALAEEQSRQRMREWEETERPYKEAAERRAGQQLELQQAQTQIGALQKQGEVGQGIIQQAVKAGVYHKVPGAERMLRFAFDPVLEAAAIAKRLSPQQSQGVPLAPVEGVPLAPVR